jgi:hypothetical protein
MKKGYIPVGGCANQVRPSALHEKWSCGRVDGKTASGALPSFSPFHPASVLHSL